MISLRLMIFFHLLSISTNDRNVYTGLLRAKITFNIPPQRDLTLLVLSESTEVLTIDKNGTVMYSFRDQKTLK